MPRANKSWQQKLADAKAKPDLPRKFFCDKTDQHFVVPSPCEIEALIGIVRKGRLTTIGDMGRRLCQVHGVQVACPMTTGIFTWLIAHAADEAAQAGAKRVTPWWRVLKTGGLLNPKFPGGGETQQAMLEAEGHRIIHKGKSLAVADYEKSLADLARAASTSATRDE